jgi:hypothetical protein
MKRALELILSIEGLLNSLESHPTIDQAQQLLSTSDELKNEFPRHEIFSLKAKYLFDAMTIWLKKIDGNVMPIRDAQHLSAYEHILWRVFELRHEVEQSI